MAKPLSPLDNFCIDEMTMSVNSPATALTGASVWKFGTSLTTRIPIHCRTGLQSFGDPTERKRFRQIEFHGKGSVYCRVYVDGVFICESNATMTETPDKERRIGLPVGTKGYCMDVEFAGDAEVRAIEFTISKMASTS